jgi:hypothetical protein
VVALLLVAGVTAIALQPQKGATGGHGATNQPTVASSQPKTGASSAAPSHPAAPVKYTSAVLPREAVHKGRPRQAGGGIHQLRRHADQYPDH